MLKQMILQVILAAAFGYGSLAAATDLTIHLKGSQPLSRITLQYQCDEQGVKMGLPAGPFPVEYVNGGGNSLAILPVGKNTLIFANIISGSGARYAANQYIWWDAAGRGTTFSSDSLAGKMQSACHRVAAK
ncbi:membrane-bound inhibitor of C-type lysozyme [Silvibacterium bohemicum]|uniref:Membrane-bound inhibitor of C-type lysozyme n=1 Tax=Silvibacterium bohemicum TaxID=1577686 RepID=A0A841JRD4_9BACT|nr:MliC family protein [Silvibacterium bohemicum]MBB6142339.1 membrane-bound inhibitor of C-type lysozyme [Silvibacterium bohemicum]